MELISTIAALKQRLRPLQQNGLRVGCVPTMGALHEGHLSLVRLARTRSEVVVGTVFVNPLQFGPTEDLSRYPRDLEGDARKLASAGCDVLFAPTPAEMYPPGFQTAVTVAEVSQGLCGASRPGHFEGVTTVVLKLLAAVRPDVAVFGEKDYQQLAVIRRMARDLALDTEILGGPLVRDADGLALSSRNVYLSAEERARALSLSRGLAAAAALYAAGTRDAQTLLGAARGIMAAAAVTPEYLELRDAEDLRPLERADEPAVMLVAARVGATRLLDNVRLA